MTLPRSTYYDAPADPIGDAEILCRDRRVPPRRRGDGDDDRDHEQDRGENLDFATPAR